MSGEPAKESAGEVRVVGRYALFDAIASGGMATVHLGRLVGPAGFSRNVAIKRLHPHLAADPEFVAMLLDEARLAGRIQHPNVAATLDVVASDGELFVVMEYLHGETLSRLARAMKAKGELIPVDIAVAVMAGALHGLHAAHEVRGDRGEPLGLVHRDVSPQNVMVRRDGTALVLDFGVAKASGRFQTTEEGKVKGKLPYMAPEQLRGGAVSRRTDVYAAAAVLWEVLVGERLFRGANEGEVLEQVLFATIDAPSDRRPGLPKVLDDIVRKGLERDAAKRFQTALEMAAALEESVLPALTSKVGRWVEALVGEALDKRASRIAVLETGQYDAQLPNSTPSAASFIVPSMRAPAPTMDVKSGEIEAVSSPSALSASNVVSSQASSPSIVSSPSAVSTVAAPPLAAEVPPAASATPAPTPRNTTYLLGAVIALLGGLLAFFVTRGAIGPAPADRPAPSATAPTTVASPSAPASVDVAPPAPTPSAIVPPPPTASTGASKTPKTPTHKVDCTVPYVLDASGKRSYKRECL